MEEKIDDWDFRESDTKEYTHRIHTYPAMMIPQIARKLIRLYGENSTSLLDPFCGSGTSLVEASLTPHLKQAHGFDLNPLAVLISKVKTTPINIEKTRIILSEILNSSEYADLPDFKNIDFWFKPQVIEDLSVLKTSISKIRDEDIKDFFLACFSETIRNTSNTRNGEFKLYRMPKEKLEDYSPDVFLEFKKIANKYIISMESYCNSKTDTIIKSSLFSSMDELPLKENSIDIIVTSPPYGDSKTTVAYGQFSRLALQWLDYEDVPSLDNRLLGGKASLDLEVGIDSPVLKKIVENVSDIDPKRAREVLSFYEDFDKVVFQLDRVLNKGGFVCFVVGNRTVKGINIPTDKIMIEMFKARGNYEYLTTYVREIPNKRMPKVNSPTNKKGMLSPTMNNEFIFILRKL